MRDGPLAMIQLTSSDTGHPDAPLLTRLWSIPPELADTFAEGMTERFGPPVESISTVRESMALAEQSGISYLHPGDPDA
jgi:hypothetical protein